MRVLDTTRLSTALLMLNTPACDVLQRAEVLRGRAMEVPLRKIERLIGVVALFGKNNSD